MIGNLGLTARMGVRARGFECKRLVGVEKLYIWSDLVLGVWAVPSRSSLF
jgi:hypothetical protein